jgi:predicted AAA+ superfamily ATPase
LRNGGHLLENMVFTALRRTGRTPFYYRTKSNREVDFILPGKGGIPLLVQVCESMASAVTRERELTALKEAMKETGSSTGIVVTREEEEAEIKDGKDLVRVLPAWKFLLEMDVLSL